jgi:hypothetical protein
MSASVTSTILRRTSAGQGCSAVREPRPRRLQGGESPSTGRRAELSAPDAVLVGDTVTPEGPAGIVPRIRYRHWVTPWWPQYSIPAGRMGVLVAATGWRVDQHLEDGDDHAVLLRRAQHELL